MKSFDEDTEPNPDINHCVDMMFNWSNTKEGSEYWSHVSMLLFWMEVRRGHPFRDKEFGDVSR